MAIDMIAIRALNPPPKGLPPMSPNLDLEAFAQEIDQRAVHAGRALADYLSQNLGAELTPGDFERHRIAGYIFERCATDVVCRFQRLIADDDGALRGRAIAIVQSACKARLAELSGGAS